MASRLRRTTRKKQTYFEWWQSRIRKLSGFENEAKQLFANTGEAYPVKGAWVVMKLALIAYYVGLYSTIIKKLFAKAYYVDFFAGPGLNRITDTADIIFGSPLLADRGPAQEKKFDKLILVEPNAKRNEALAKLLPAALIIPEDINTGGIDRVLELLPDDAPSLVFVDPEGLEIHWNTLVKIFARWCDMIINFQSSSIERSVATARTDISREPSLDLFFGTADWRNCLNEDSLLELYVTRLKQYRPVVIPIRVQGPGIFHYHIIVAVKKTKGPQGWIEAIERAKNKIEAATSDDLKPLLDVYHRRQTTFTDFKSLG